jgi:surface polysaccharide O-acyltransferase-like enzyme
MRFPPYLFGYPMTIELWYILVFIGAVLIMWLLTKIFKTLSRDFAAGFIIFILIIGFMILMLNLTSGSSQIESGVERWLNNLFR